MMDAVISLLDGAAATALPTQVRVGLVEQRTIEGRVRPIEYVGNGQGRSVIEDSKGSVSYWRLLSPWTQGAWADKSISVCANAITRVYALRYVVYMDRKEELCAKIFDALGGAGTALMNASDAIETASDMMMVDVMPVASEPDTVRAFAQEYPGDVPIDKAMAYIDVRLTMSGDADCFEEC